MRIHQPDLGILGEKGIQGRIESDLVPEGDPFDIQFIVHYKTPPMPGSAGTAERRAAEAAAPEWRACQARLRAPRVDDAAAIWQVVRRDAQLDANAPYAYLLLCSHFAGTGLVAEDASGLVGFVLGYAIPERPDVLFVWQVAVAPSHRGRGLGGRMLDALLARPACRAARALEATVTPGNRASRSLFAAFARRAGAELREAPGFSADLFPAAHGEERLLHVAPLSAPSKRHHPQET